MTRQELRDLHELNQANTQRALAGERVITRMKDLEELRKMLLNLNPHNFPVIAQRIKKMDLEDIKALTLPLFQGIQDRFEALNIELDQL